MKRKFKFLDPYLKDDKNIFFGRDNESFESYNKLFNSKLLLLYGASGTGKTSILNCGVANLFADTDWFPVEIRRKGNILDSFSKEIHKNAITEIPDDKNLTEQVHSLYLDFYKPIYLIFDQFEELFISGSKTEQREFIDILKDILNSDLSVKVIISIREEYLAYLTDFEKIIPNIFDNKVRIERMSNIKAEDVVIKTCKALDIQLENEIETPKIIISLLGQQKFGVELTYLQVLLDKLYTTAYQVQNENVVFNDEVIEIVGNVDDVLSNFLDEQLQKMPDPKLAWKILKVFVSEEGTKLSRVTKDIQTTLKQWNVNVDTKHIDNYLQKFISLKIVRLIKDKNTNIFELAHDSLAKKIFESMTSEERHLLERRSFLLASFKNHKINTALLNKKDIAYIEPYIDHLNVERDVELYFYKSKRAIKKRLVGLITIIVSVMLVMSLITVYSFIQQKKATKAEKIAKESEMKAKNAETKATTALENFRKEKSINIKNRIDKLFEKAQGEIDATYYINAQKTLDNISKLNNGNDSTNVSVRVILLRKKIEAIQEKLK